MLCAYDMILSYAPMLCAYDMLLCYAPMLCAMRLYFTTALLCYATIRSVCYPPMLSSYANLSSSCTMLLGADGEEREFVIGCDLSSGYAGTGADMGYTGAGTDIGYAATRGELRCRR
eukprot:1340876-Rhodomonas_salina.1